MVKSVNVSLESSDILIKQSILSSYFLEIEIKLKFRA